MRVEAFVVSLRARNHYEGADLGVRICQASAYSVFCCYWSVAVPLCLICLAIGHFHSPWSILAIWLAKPWLDRTVLFVLARTAFGTATRLSDLWRARRPVWGGQLITTLIWQRLSVRRSFTQPIYQLEGLRGRARRARVAVIGRRARYASLGLTGAYALAELGLLLGVIFMAYWISPAGQGQHAPDIFQGGDNGILTYLWCIGYALIVCLLEPFYVAAGFGLYISRRVELEAWDIEQEFRAVFEA